MVSGTVCPACDGRLAATSGEQYECDDCGRRFDVTDMFMP